MVNDPQLTSPPRRTFFCMKKNCMKKNCIRKNCIKKTAALTLFVTQYSGFLANMYL